MLDEEMLHEQELKRLGRERDIELLLNDKKVSDTKEQIYNIISNLDNNELEQELVDELVYIHKVIDIYNVRSLRKKVKNINSIIYEQHKKKVDEANTDVLYFGLFLTAIVSVVFMAMLYCGPTPRGKF